MNATRDKTTTTMNPKGRALRGLLIAAFFVSPAVALATFAEEWTGNVAFAAAAATAAGIIAYVYLLNLFIIGTRPPRLLRLFGETGLLRFHVGISLVSVFLAGVHGVVKATTMSALSPQVQSGQIAFIALVGAGAVGASALAGPVSRGVATLARYTAGSRAWTRVRNITGAAVLVGLFHVLYASTTLAATARTLVMGGWFVLAVGAYLRHLIRAARETSGRYSPEGRVAPVPEASRR